MNLFALQKPVPPKAEPKPKAKVKISASLCYTLLLKYQDRSFINQ